MFTRRPNGRNQRAQQFQPLRHQFRREIIYPGQIGARPGETRNQTNSDRVFADAKDD
jgi:hypothetical protein